jgi:hypothetical protein
MPKKTLHIEKQPKRCEIVRIGKYSFIFGENKTFGIQDIPIGKTLNETVLNLYYAILKVITTKVEKKGNDIIIDTNLFCKETLTDGYSFWKVEA